MAVKVPKGKSKIVFTYRTPGFKAGTRHQPVRAAAL